MPTAFDKNILPEFGSVMDADERILASPRPKFLPFILAGPGTALFTLAFGIIWVLTLLNMKPENDSSGGMAWMFGLLPIGQGLFMMLNRIFSFPNTTYAYTDKRVMMRSGFIGTDFKSIDYDKISDIEVTVNWIERAFNVGTVRFFSGRTKNDGDEKLYDSWIAVPDPYLLFKEVKRVATDIKTDVQFPNAMRPEVNPGYTTRYEPRK